MLLKLKHPGCEKSEAKSETQDTIGSYVTI